MKLYVRHKQGIFINFIHDIDEFKVFEENLIPGRHLVIGDIATFTKLMKYRLLKLVEENSEIDCYSSRDITDPILLSRFVEIIKEPLDLVKAHSVDEFRQSAKDYTSSESLLNGCSTDVRLRAPLVSDVMLNLIQNL